MGRKNRVSETSIFVQSFALKHKKKEILAKWYQMKHDQVTKGKRQGSFEKEAGQFHHRKGEEEYEPTLSVSWRKSSRFSQKSNIKNIFLSSVCFSLKALAGLLKKKP